MFDGPAAFGGREIISSVKALEAHGIAPIPLVSKEHLGILNGTAFSASLASLALNEAVHLTLLSQVLTAMGTEALAGTRASFDPFIHSVARPHPGQVRDRFAVHPMTQTADTFLRLKRLRISSAYWKAASSPKSMTKRLQSRRMKALFVKTDTHCALHRSSLGLRLKISFNR